MASWDSQRVPRGTTSLGLPCHCRFFRHCYRLFVSLLRQLITSLGIPPKIDDAFAKGRYVPYTSLTLAARLKAARGEEEFIINAQGGLTAKGPDRRDENTIMLVDWLGAANAAEERTRFHHGDARADALAKHHRNVTNIARKASWSFAVEYDIKQRELAGEFPQHDLSTLDLDCITMLGISKRVEASPKSQQGASSSASSTNAGKRKRANSSSGSPRKRSAQLCFRCGFAGHMPDACKAETTSAGQPVAPLNSTARSKNSLMGPNSKPFCFSWAKDSSCTFGDNCRNHHACSLCGSSTHGAADCRARA